MGDDDEVGNELGGGLSSSVKSKVGGSARQIGTYVYCFVWETKGEEGIVTLEIFGVLLRDFWEQ